MNVRDWRTMSSAEVAPLYQSEIARWERVLHWDTRANWRLVEAARAAGTVPGLVVHDATGAVHGWAFYLLHAGVLQVGALVCGSPAATAAVLSAILESSEAGAASSVTLFTFADAPALACELQREGFATDRYRYLQRSLTEGPERVAESDVAQASRPARYADPMVRPAVCSAVSGARRPWQASDIIPVAALLSRAYGAPDASRPFVRQGRPEDWVEYVEQLVTTRGCGVFLPEVTVIGESSSGVDAVVLATRLGAGTAHLAQVAVEPTAHRSGRGRLIVSLALSNLREAGYDRATLLVSAANGAAIGLYEQLGFLEAGAFIAAARDQPRRSKNAALATGGASIFR